MNSLPTASSGVTKLSNTAVKVAWEAAWDQCRQRRIEKNKKTVLVADPVLNEVRALLDPVGDEYSMPVIRNPELDLFCALAFSINPIDLEHHWEKLRQIYEQEMETRVYQERAREGALRDTILAAFDAVPDLTGDFLAILCYFCFPNFDLHFLDRFTHNKGQSIQTRQARIPYLMYFLSDSRMPSVKVKEDLERGSRLELARQARKAAKEA